MRTRTGLKELSHMKNASAYKAFVTSVQSKFAEIGRQNIAEKVINPLLREVKDLDMRQRLGEFYNQFLDEVYPNGGSPERSAADVEAEWDSHFFGSDESANEGWGQRSETQGADTDDYDRDTPEEEVHDRTRLSLMQTAKTASMCKIPKPMQQGWFLKIRCPKGRQRMRQVS